MSRIIGLSGKSGSGKDTVADMIVALLGEENTVKIPFAQAIKDEASKLGWNGEKDTNGRVLLQYLGARERKDDPYHWIQLTLEKIAAVDKLFKMSIGREMTFVIPDVRFVNEAQVVHQYLGEVWRITRPGAGLQGMASLHPSETALDEFPNFDNIVHNCGSLDDLRELVVGLLEPNGGRQPLGQAVHLGEA